MARFFAKIFVFFTLALMSTSAQVRQQATLYHQSGNSGEYFVLDAVYNSNLGTRNWNNRARSVCVTGTWLFYDYSNFNFGVDASMEYVVGLGKHCTDFTSNMATKVTSVRFAGYQNDYRSDSLTLYENVFFQGDEEYFAQDAGKLKLDRLSKSLIITGKSAWTIFDQPDFRGNTLCVYPPNNAKEFSPALVTDTAKDIKAPYNTIRSVRKGCIGRNSVTTIAKASSGNFTVVSSPLSLNE